MQLAINLFTLLLTVSGLLSTTLAVPVDNAAPDVVERGEPGNAALCDWHSSERYDRVYNVQSAGAWDDDHGKGFLDNLHGQCGWDNVEFFAFQYGPGGPDEYGYSTFGLDNAAPANCVENAIWLASQPFSAIWNVHCAEKELQS